MIKNHKGLPYCIAFDTKEMPGKIVGVRVQLDKHVFGMGDGVNVALCEHPLYPQLETYVRDNPSKRK